METIQTARYTYADYRSLDVDDNYLYELIDGELVKKSAPSPQHQLISGNLYSLLKSFVVAKQAGKVLYAPVDVFVDDYNAPQPDLLYISQTHLEYITPDGIFGPPDLVVEIVSPTSISRDYVKKLRIYERFGVAEYWIVNPNYRSVEVYQLINQEYNLVSSAVETGKVQSKVLTGLELNINEVFAE
ncbi:MAG: Uma2 family endonuclease [Ferruginibacter sp.]|nr:Uma2 family endonuclease [Cytophagales bacterium]